MLGIVPLPSLYLQLSRSFAAVHLVRHLDLGVPALGREFTLVIELCSCPISLSVQ